MNPDRTISVIHAYRAVRRFWRETKPAPQLVLAGAGLQAIQVPVTLASPFLAQRLFDQTLVSGRVPELLLVGGGLLLIALLASAARQGHDEIAIRLRSRARARVARRLFAHLAHLPLSFFTARDSGYLTSRLRGDLRTIGNLMPDAAVAALADTLRATCFFAVLVALDGVMAAAAIGLTAGLVFLVSRLTSPLSNRFHAALETSAQGATSIQALISGMAVLRTLGAADRQARRCGRAQLASIRADAGRDRLQMLATNAMSASAQVGIALILMVGAYRMLRGDLTVGTLLASFVALSQLINAGESALSFVPGFLDGLAGLERIDHLLAQAPETASSNARTPSSPARGAIAFERVAFAYTPETPVLRDLSFRIAPGETVALVGTSGAGKSTIAHLLTRLYEPSSGTIRLDGQPLDHFTLPWLRKQIGLVSQQVFLLDGTIRENLMLGQPDTTEAALRRAAHQAAADGFIARLPEGYATRVGENGVRLSGGQRQRLALARELLRPSRVLILDEATSNLDARTEARVRRTIATLLGQRTCIVIAHRASTLRLANRILVLDDGRVVAAGSHEALLARSRTYRRLLSRPRSGPGVGDPDRVVVEVEPPARHAVEFVEPGAVVGGAVAGTTGQ